MKKFFAWAGYLLLCTICLGGGAAASLLGSNPVIWQGIRQTVFRVDPFAGQDGMYLLILGCDENRYYGGKQILSKYARTDTIQLVRIDFKHKAVGMMQIPRDTVVSVPGYPRQKINGLHTVGGRDATVAAVEMLTGIHPDRVIVLDYAAIRKMIDEVGGVEVYVDKKMNYDDVRGDLHVHLDPGRKLLDGKTAIGYLRWRHDSDFFRGKRQQEFMVAFKEKIANTVSWSHFPRLADLAYKVVGGGISTEEFVALGKFAQDVPPARIKKGMLPIIEGHGTQLEPVMSKIPDALVECGLKDAPPSSATSTVAHR